MKQLTQYILALVNLYGILPKEKALSIYASQNMDSVDPEEIEILLENPTKEMKDASVVVYMGYFMKKSILENDEFHQILREKGDKPFYVPQKEELLKYTDELYFEKSKAYHDFLSYIKKNFFGENDESAVQFAESVYGLCEYSGRMQYIFNLFDHYNIILKDRKQVEEVVLLTTQLMNNTRTWENNGHTPIEIHQIYDAKKSIPLWNKTEADSGGAKVINMSTREKIGRNEPCPCGSGKKYKNCCMRKS